MNNPTTLSHRRHLWLALFLAFLFALWVQLPRIADPYVVEEDFRNLYWLQRYQDPASAEQRALYHFLGSLPADVLLAGDPCSLNGVPLYARRSTLLRCEPGSFPHDETTLDDLRATYAARRETVVAFCQDYAVDYLVVDREKLNPEVIEDGSYFFAPYTTILYEELAGRNNFYLDNPDAAGVVFSAPPTSSSRAKQ